MKNSTANLMREKKFVIQIVTGRGGAGHYATYHAIREAAWLKQMPWQFQVTDMDDVMACMTQKKKVMNAYSLLGSSPSGLYNLMLKKGWTWLWPFLIRLNKLMVRLNYQAGVKFFKGYWQEQRPDLVLSIVTMCNRVLSESLEAISPGTPYVVLPSDFADCPPGFWIEPETDNYTICSTEKLLQQAYTLGLKKERVLRTSGLVIHPKFYEPLTNTVQVERQRLNLAPDCLTGIVSFGGNGSSKMLEISRRLESFHGRLQLIFLCGRNQELATALRRYQGSQKRFVTTFTDNVSYYMHLADFFIGKPGNVSIGEAMAMKLPVITELNALTMIHERHCCELIVEKELGIVISNFREVNRAVAKLLQSDIYAYYRRNLDKINNHAVFEVVEYLQDILQKTYLSNYAESTM